MVSEDFEELHKDDDVEDMDEHHSHFKKIYLYFIGGLLILFMLSFIFVTFPVGDILAGKIESDSLVNGKIESDDVVIVFSDDVLEKLQKVYAADQSVEFSLCLQGSREGDVYIINSLYQPKTYSQQFNQVSFESCKDTLVLLHSHPQKRCIASQTDLNGLKNARLENSEIIMLVMCSWDRFSVY